MWPFAFTRGKSVSNPACVRQATARFSRFGSVRATAQYDMAARNAAPQARLARRARSASRVRRAKAFFIKLRRRPELPLRCAGGFMHPAWSARARAFERDGDGL